LKPLLADEVGTFEDAVDLAQSVKPISELAALKQRLRAYAQPADELAALKRRLDSLRARG
jgi:hypothetical protein